MMGEVGTFCVVIGVLALCVALMVIVGRMVGKSMEWIQKECSDIEIDFIDDEQEMERTDCD